LKQNTLSKSERLKSKKDIEEIFSDNKSFVSSDKKILLLYKIVKQEGIKPELKFAVTVPKKSGSAVWRNRIKRLIREAYRTNKFILLSDMTSAGAVLKLVFIPFQLNQKKNKKVSLDQVLPGVLELLMKIKEKVLLI
jgi:ribonuclease P protein component